MSPFTSKNARPIFFSRALLLGLLLLSQTIDDEYNATFTNQFCVFLSSFEKQTKQRRFVGGDDETGRSRAAGIYHSGVHVRDVRIVPS